MDTPKINPNKFLFNPENNIRSAFKDSDFYNIKKAVKIFSMGLDWEHLKKGEVKIELRSELPPIELLPILEYLVDQLKYGVSNTHLTPIE